MVMTAPIQRALLMATRVTIITSITRVQVRQNLVRKLKCEKK